MSKLLFFDVDDTLLHHRGDISYIPNSTVRAIKELKQNGHMVAIASGRGTFQMTDIMGYLGIDKVVAFNGGEIVHKDEVIFRKPLHRGDIKRLIDGLNKDYKPFIITTKDELFYKDFLGLLWYKYFRKVKPIDNIKENAYMVRVNKFKYKRDRNREYYGLMIINNKFDDLYGYDNLFFKSWGERGFEITNKGVSKLTGITKMAEHLCVSMDDVIVFGDNYNDIEMLEGIKTSVAMGNAVDEAKDVASFTTKHIANDGIFYACKYFGLI